jgi:DNA-binding ferritin-like protein
MKEGPMLQQLATILRIAQIYTHAAHNKVSGQTFFQDHEFLGELYPAYEAAFDSVVERSIGLNQNVDFTAITEAAARYLKSASLKDCRTMLEEALYFEEQLCKEVEKLAASPLSQGTLQMVGTLADESESRQYKLKQRLK